MKEQNNQKSNKNTHSSSGQWRLLNALRRQTNLFGYTLLTLQQQHDFSLMPLKCLESVDKTSQCQGIHVILKYFDIQANYRFNHSSNFIIFHYQGNKYLSLLAMLGFKAYSVFCFAGRKILKPANICGNVPQSIIHSLGWQCSPPRRGRNKGLSGQAPGLDTGMLFTHYLIIA